MGCRRSWACRMRVTDRVRAARSADPYGATTAGTDPGDTNPYRYTGAYTDNTTGTIHLGARFYQPTLGTFTQPDPSRQEANSYLYTGANPVNRTDPSGLFTAGFNVSVCGGRLVAVCIGLSLNFVTGTFSVNFEVGFGVGAIVQVNLSVGQDQPTYYTHFNICARGLNVDVYTDISGESPPQVQVGRCIGSGASFTVGTQVG